MTPIRDLEVTIYFRKNNDKSILKPITFRCKFINHCHDGLVWFEDVEKCDLVNKEGTDLYLPANMFLTMNVRNVGILEKSDELPMPND